MTNEQTIGAWISGGLGARVAGVERAASAAASGRYGLERFESIWRTGKSAPNPLLEFMRGFDVEQCDQSPVHVVQLAGIPHDHRLPSTSIDGFVPEPRSGTSVSG